jgi:hypothetical protein
MQRRSVACKSKLYAVFSLRAGTLADAVGHGNLGGNVLENGVLFFGVPHSWLFSAELVFSAGLGEGG